MKKVVQTAGRNALGTFAPDFAHYNDDVLFGENWNNQDIDLKTRSIITVVALVGPFILLSSPVLALCIMLVMALLIIAFFNYYYAIARNESFKRRLTEMAVLSFSVAGISFLIGYLLKTVTGVGG